MHAQDVLDRYEIKAVSFGAVSAVVPDYKIARRHDARKAAHDLLEIACKALSPHGSYCSRTLGVFGELLPCRAHSSNLTQKYPETQMPDLTVLPG
eukprot:6156137-Amphidinium_carterae.1